MMTLVFSENKIDVIIEDFFGTKINWTKMQMAIKVSEKIPRVIIDENDVDYGKENTAFNISEARNKTLILAKDKIKIHFARSIENIQINDELTIKDSINKNLKFREKFNEFFLRESNELKVKYIQDEVRVDSNLSLKGNNGLLNFLDIDFGIENFPEYSEKKKFSEFTGLIIDARHLELKPSLFPKIISDKGLEIYSSNFVDKNFALQNGLVLFLRDPKLAINHERIGKKSYYLLATNTLGKNNVNLSIPTSEAIKILSSEETKKNLRKCKVIILVK